MRKLALFALLFIAYSTHAAEHTLLILHTNDLHDHIRADYDGTGGLAYVSGYIAQVRAQQVRVQRDDVLLLDAGDVMEKGDLAAYRDQSRIMYEAIGLIGYDAIAPGNHDDSYGDDHLVACAALAPNTATLAINLLDESGARLFPASKIFERNGLRIGVIGVFKPRDERSLDLDETAAAIAEEAQRLEPEVHLIIVVAHLGPKDCEVIAEAAPEVGVFVSGHTHQALARPIRSRHSQAYIVQAGSYAEFVGRLELTIDDESEDITKANGELIAMNHATVPHDAELQALFTAREKALAPEAADLVTAVIESLSFFDLAYLGAEGIRRAADVDIAFCHASQIIRATLPVGPVDINALFRTGGQRAHDIVETALTGAEINAYVEGLANSSWGVTHWSGFSGKYTKIGKRKTFESDLDPIKSYRVAMPNREWETRFQRVFNRANDLPPTIDPTRILALTPKPSATTFTNAVVALIRDTPAASLTQLAESIRDHALHD